MAYFAQLDADGAIAQIIVADAEFVKRKEAEWLEIVADLPHLRATLDRQKSRWIGPRPNETWVLDEAAGKWNPATPVRALDKHADRQPRPTT